MEVQSGEVSAEGDNFRNFMRAKKVKDLSTGRRN